MDVVSAVVAGDLLILQFGRGEQLLLVDPGLVTLPVQQVDEVLRGGIAGGAGGKGTASQTAQGGLHRIYPAAYRLQAVKIFTQTVPKNKAGLLAKPA